MVQCRSTIWFSVHRCGTKRTYATQRPNSVSGNTTSPLLSHALDQKRRSARRDDAVGPFQLGLIPPTPEEVGEVKKWSELKTGEKVVRTAARTSNLVVILFGAGLTAVLAYALTSEMFSKNSPTVLYGKACELIKESPKVAQYLQGPLVFHNNPPAVIRPKHRNHLSSQIYVDSYGREHMRLHFFVQGKPPGSHSEDEEGIVSSIMNRVQNLASQMHEMSYDEMSEVAKAHARDVWDSCRELFRFLSGNPVPPPQYPHSSPPEISDEPKKTGWMSGVTGLFSGLRGASKSLDGTGEDSSSPSGETEGEVHADLAMARYFEFRYLVVDIPESSAPNRKRVFVLRSDNDRNSRWYK
ncbi:hypothetical protein K474DRAFT_1598295 [Panus rudis PR-1116 ss-1]|nr:hypothetical protein K474DRAFT_1598295 [Panus rudis PR-1116 ss-1]